MSKQTLGKRQKQIIELVSQGKQTKFIAHMMDIAESTVKAHIRILMQKYGVSNRTELAAIYLAEERETAPHDGFIRVYLSGPMTGLPDYNYPEFHRVTAILRERGYYVFSPAEWWKGDIENFPVRRAFAAFCKFICLEADKLVMLPGWQQSKGACVEYRLAQAIGVKVEEWRE